MIGVVSKQPQRCMRSAAVVCGMRGAAVQKGDSRIFAEKAVVENRVYITVLQSYAHNLGGLSCCKVWTRYKARTRCKTECRSAARQVGLTCCKVRIRCKAWTRCKDWTCCKAASTIYCKGCTRSKCRTRCKAWTRCKSWTCCKARTSCKSRTC